MIKTFSELTEAQLALAGGKGGVLAKLYQEGYPVPDGFVILPEAFEGSGIKPEAWPLVQAQLANMRRAGGDVSFAVRSSALSEDSAQASFGGQFETVLDVRTDEAIREAIQTVYDSRHGERVRAYTEAKGIAISEDIAVVVQRLVRSDIAGVLFTADPVTGNRTIMTGNYIHGLGDRLVSGEADAENFTLERPKGKYDGPAAIKRHARQLYKLSARLERDLGSPQDIEWAVAGGTLYILQSRPITTMQECDPITQDWNSTHIGDFLWGNSAGVYPEVLTPSSWSIWWMLLGGRMAGIPFLGNICGRLYINYSLTYAMLRKFGRSHEEITGSIALTLGAMPDLEFPSVPMTIGEVLESGSIPLLMKQRRLMKNASEFLSAMPERCQEMRKRIQKADKAELARLWHEELEPLARDIYLMQDASNEGYLIPYTTLKRDLGKLLGEADATALIATISGGQEQLVSVGIAAGLAEVARGEMTREAYMHDYGHRHANENELMVPRPYEDPAWLDAQLVETAKASVDIDSLLSRRAAEFEAAWAAFESNYPRQAKGLRKRIDAISARTQLRERIRSELTRTVGVMRAWFLRAGELTGLGDAAFFLTYEEMLDVLAGNDSVTEHIPARREVLEKYSALPPYPTLIRGRFDPFQWAADPNRRSDVFDAHAPVEAVSESDTIQGYAGSAGRMEGIVRIIHSPEEGDQLRPGEILAATTTNIGWTPIFPKAAAVITDVGAPLAHAAIVARELGIPAVVGCGNATMRLRTGDRVLVDGGQGIVTILEKARS